MTFENTVVRREAESGASGNPGGDPLSASSFQTESSETRRAKHILIADDSKVAVFVIREALRKSGIDAQIHVTTDGEQTIRFLEDAERNPSAPCPDLILLDINMPEYKGGDVLVRLRGSQRCRNSPVLIVTSSDSQEDRARMEELGACGYFHKPSGMPEMLKLGQRVRELLAMSDPAGSA